jgi:tRNA threonylcarbamoyladenosine biosynthesis protein TsaB
LILIIESSAQYCSAVIATAKGEIIAEKNSVTENAHAEELPTMVWDLLSENKINPSQLEAIGVSKGPGSYTGLRIGISLAKGICFSTHKPIITLNAYKGMALAASFIENADYLFSHLDARRNEIYLEIYNKDMEIKKSIHFHIIQSHDFQEYSGKILFCGNANEKIKNLLDDKINCTYVDIQPKASYLAKEAVEKLNAAIFEDLAYFEPFYMKDFIPGISKKFNI